MALQHYQHPTLFTDFVVLRLADQLPDWGPYRELTPEMVRTMAVHLKYHETDAMTQLHERGSLRQLALFSHPTDAIYWMALAYISENQHWKDGPFVSEAELPVYEAARRFVDGVKRGLAAGDLVYYDAGPKDVEGTLAPHHEAIGTPEQALEHRVLS